MKKFFIFFIIILLCFLVGCGEKECKKDEDCTAMSCFSVACEENQCLKTPQPGCCGNLMCEDDENSCSCSKDCKKPKCEGKVVTKQSGSKKYYAQYLEYMCVEDICMRTFDESVVNKIPLLSEKKVNNMDLEIGATFNKPFDLSKDKIMVTITLKDFDDSKVKMPFKIKKIKVMSGDILYGDINVNKELLQVGSGIKEFVQLTFKPEELEKEQKLELRIDYEVTKVNNKGDELLRDDFSETFSQKLFLINTGLAELEE
ncbi:hypothetical protein HOC35_04325 [Candidatus Woesearchaeota archaeon]|nr:hypothetical protein [Candidatus Woesearchaeota archaeon]